MAVWLQAKRRERGLRLRPRLYAGPVSDDSAAETAYAALYKLTLPLPFRKKKMKMDTRLSNTGHWSVINRERETAVIADQHIRRPSTRSRRRSVVISRLERVESHAGRQRRKRIHFGPHHRFVDRHRRLAVLEKEAWTLNTRFTHFWFQIQVSWQKNRTNNTLW